MGALSNDAKKLITEIKQNPKIAATLNNLVKDHYKLLSKSVQQLTGVVNAIANLKNSLTDPNNVANYTSATVELALHALNNYLLTEGGAVLDTGGEVLLGKMTQRAFKSFVPGLGYYELAKTANKLGSIGRDAYFAPKVIAFNATTEKLSDEKATVRFTPASTQNLAMITYMEDTRVRQLITQVFDFIECEFKTCPYNRLNC